MINFRMIPSASISSLRQWDSIFRLLRLLIVLLDWSTSHLVPSVSPPTSTREFMQKAVDVNAIVSTLVTKTPMSVKRFFSVLTFPVWTGVVCPSLATSNNSRTEYVFLHLPPHGDYFQERFEASCPISSFSNREYRTFGARLKEAVQHQCPKLPVLEF